MALIYDQNVFNHYRSLAITDLKDIVVGETYYTNDGEEIYVKELISYDDQVRRRNINDSDRRFNSNYNEIAWIISINGNYYSLKDRNVGASYNPWLLFKTKELAEECKKNLKIEYERDYDDYQYYDYEYD